MLEKRCIKNKIKRGLFHPALILSLAVVMFSVYCAYTAYRTYSLYQYVKTRGRGWAGHIYRADKELGFSPISGSSGFELMPLGEDIPMRYDKEGFRAPMGDDRDRRERHPVILFLGCSFTYGAAVHAKDTFSYLVGKYLGGTTKNAGVGSYGLSQMVILANRLIPRYQPDYVIVQYSPWLVSRAMSPFAPTYFGKLTNPYYSENPDLKISPPVFQTIICNLPINEYRSSRKSFGDFLSFIWKVGLPLFIHDDFKVSAYRIASILGLKARPTTDFGAVRRRAYKEINKVAEQNGATVIVVILGGNAEPIEFQKDFLPKNVIVVDAHGAMLERLPIKDQKSYEAQYYNWRGNPPRVVDGHPNETAHQIIAKEILSHIGKPVNQDH